MPKPPHNIARLAIGLLLFSVTQPLLAAEGSLHTPVKGVSPDTRPSGDPGTGNGAPTSGDDPAHPSAGGKPPAKLSLAGVVDSPSRIQVSYDVLKDNIKAAIITETYTRTQNRYYIESVSKAVGLLAMIKPETIRITSKGTLTPKGLRPLILTHKRELDTERNTRADFDWTSNHITLTDRAGKRTVPLPADTQDRLSAMYQFMFVPLKDAATLDFHMTNGSKVDIYNYLITADQSVTVPLGTFKALYVASPPKAGESRTEIWLATEHANFPYKMVITDPDGDKLTQVLTQFDFVP